MLLLRIQNTPQIRTVRVWVGRENLFFSFKRSCSATKRFLYERKIIKCCKTQYNQFTHWGII